MRVTVRTRDHGTSLALGLTLAATTFVASYALQRLWAAASGEPTWTDLVVQARTPYFWRCSLALLHAVLAGTTAWLGASDGLATTALRFAPVWVPAVVLPLALAMAAVP